MYRVYPCDAPNGPTISIWWDSGENMGHDSVEIARVWEVADARRIAVMLNFANGANLFHHVKGI